MSTVRALELSTAVVLALSLMSVMGLSSMLMKGRRAWRRALCFSQIH
jgi:hypothetical protein